MSPGNTLTKKTLILVSLFLVVQIFLFFQMESLSSQAESDFDQAVKAKQFTDEINEFSEEFYRFTKSAYDMQSTREDQMKVLDQLLGTLHALQERAAKLMSLSEGNRNQRKAIKQADDALTNAIQIVENLKLKLAVEAAAAKSAGIAGGGASELVLPKEDRSRFRHEIAKIREIGMLGQDARAEMNRKFDEHSRLRGQSKNMLIASLIFVAASTLLGAWLLLQHVTRRLNIIHKNVYRLAAGAPLYPVLGGDDELAALDANFHSMAERLERVKKKELALLDKAVSLMCSVDSSARFTTINPASIQLLGQPPESLIGAHLSTVVAAKDLDRVRNVLQSKEPPPNLEATLMHKTGSSVETLWSIRHEGDVAVCIIHDVTERKQAESKRQDLISLVTEELQYPMNAIGDFLQSLDSGRFGKQSENGQGLLVLAMRSIRRMSNLVNDLLDAERIKTGQIELKRRDVDGQTLVNAAIAPLENWASEFGVKLTAKTAKFTVNVDEERIGRVLTNLISNAVKYSPKDSTVSVEAKDAGTKVEFFVIDQGRGIAPDVIDDLFKPFVQAKTDDRSRGTGLGLSICKDIVELHGGEISVTSVEGKGSSFRFSIPN